MDHTVLIGAAVLAPSSHNTQPWRFRSPDAATIELLADRSRALPVNDPHDRELTISCGCAAFNLLVAGEHSGTPAQLALLPHGAESDLLVRASINAPSSNNRAISELNQWIAQRRTYRKRFAAQPVPQQVQQHLVDAADSDGCQLHLITADERRNRLADLVARGDAEQWAQPAWRRELGRWMHPPRMGDGLTVPSLAAPVTQAIVRTFDMGSGVAARDRQLAEASPLLAVLGSTGDAPLDWLHAGMALERLLLVACSFGLQASYLNQPVQCQQIRPELADLTGTPCPQIVLRFGFPEHDTQPSPRRPVRDVIDAAPPSPM